MIFFKVLYIFIYKGAFVDLTFSSSSEDSLFFSWVWLISGYKHQNILQVFLRIYKVFVRLYFFLKLYYCALSKLGSKSWVIWWLNSNTICFFFGSLFFLGGSELLILWNRANIAFNSHEIYNTFTWLLFVSLGRIISRQQSL